MAPEPTATAPQATHLHSVGAETIRPHPPFGLEAGPASMVPSSVPPMATAAFESDVQPTASHPANGVDGSDPALHPPPPPPTELVDGPFMTPMATSATPDLPPEQPTMFAASATPDLPPEQPIIFATSTGEDDLWGQSQQQGGDASEGGAAPSSVQQSEWPQQYTEQQQQYDQWAAYYQQQQQQTLGQGAEGAPLGGAEGGLSPEQLQQQQQQELQQQQWAAYYQQQSMQQLQTSSEGTGAPAQDGQWQGQTRYGVYDPNAYSYQQSQQYAASGGDTQMQQNADHRVDPSSTSEWQQQQWVAQQQQQQQQWGGQQQLEQQQYQQLQQEWTQQPAVAPRQTISLAGWSGTVPAQPYAQTNSIPPSQFLTPTSSTPATPYGFASHQQGGGGMGSIYEQQLQHQQQGVMLGLPVTQQAAKSCPNGRPGCCFVTFGFGGQAVLIRPPGSTNTGSTNQGTDLMGE